MRFFLVLLILIPLSSHADQALNVTVHQGCDYALRWNPETDTLQLSGNESWNPWMPEDVFGWQILDEGQLRSMFYCTHDFVGSIDFDEQMVLAVVRYDSVDWNFFPRKVTFTQQEPALHIDYDAITRTLRPQKPSLSTAIFLIDITESLRKTGISNLRFSVTETQRGPWKPGQSPYPSPTADVWFPVAHSPQQLKRSFEYRARQLSQLQPAGVEIEWMPDYVILEGAHLQPDLNMQSTTYLLIDDSTTWANTFRPMWGKTIDERLIFTSGDFRQMFALAVVKRKPGNKMSLGECFWTEQGYRINIETNRVPGRTGPEVLVVLFPRGDYGIMSFRENGAMIDPNSLR